MSLAAWKSHPLVERARTSLLWRIVVALYEINLRDRALTLAGQAFIALVPLLIVVATLVTRSDAIAAANFLIDKFALAGSTADAVRALFSRPPETTGGLSIIGLLVLLFSVNSFARLLQRTYEVAWGLSQRAPRRAVLGMGGALVLLATLGGSAYLSGLVVDLPGGRVTTLMVQLCVATPGWWLMAWLLLSGRVGKRRLLPGALTSAMAQVLTTWAGMIWVPFLIERNAERYGVIGVAIALISWMVVLAFLVVASAVVGAHLGSAFAREKGVER